MDPLKRMMFYILLVGLFVVSLSLRCESGVDWSALVQLLYEALYGHI